MAQGQLLASAVRTATVSSDTFRVDEDLQGQRLIVFLNVTAASGTGGLTLTVEGYDIASQSWFRMVAGSALITTGKRIYALGNGVSAAAAADITAAVAAPVPESWRVTVTHGDASNYTYSVGYSLS